MAVSSGRLSASQIADVMRKAGWPESAIPVGVAVAFAESGGNPRAVNRANRNGSSDYGLFQINSVHGSLLNEGDRYDPVANARMALKVYKGAGNSWKPWSTYNSGSYRKFYKANPGGDKSAALVGTDIGGASESLIGSAVAGSTVGAFNMGFIGDRSFWQRFGLGALGVLLIIVGIVIVFRRPIGDGVKTVVSLVPQGKVLKAAGAAKGMAG